MGQSQRTPVYWCTVRGAWEERSPLCASSLERQRKSPRGQVSPLSTCCLQRHREGDPWRVWVACGRCSRTHEHQDARVFGGAWAWVLLWRHSVKLKLTLKSVGGDWGRLHSIAQVSLVGSVQSLRRKLTAPLQEERVLLGVFGLELQDQLSPGSPASPAALLVSDFTPVTMWVKSLNQIFVFTNKYMLYWFCFTREPWLTHQRKEASSRNLGVINV